MSNMKKLNHIQSQDLDLAGFIIDVNLDIDEINKLIDAYNSTVAQEESLNKLKEILRYKQFIENKHSNKHVDKCIEFSNEIHVNLFSVIQTEFATYGISNLYGIADSNPPAPQPAHNFSEILANMTPEKLELLFSILLQGAFFKKAQFQRLYTPKEQGYLEFNNFLTNNSISFLGGGNSKNFKISPNDGSPPYVLKLENRLGMPNLPTVHLRSKSLKETLTPIMTERQVTGEEYGKPTTRTILTTAFCAGGDLMAHSSTHDLDDVKRAQSAFNIYQQMLHILIGVSKDGCAFPDMKNNNWLIDPKGKLMLADAKSFIFCEMDGRIDYIKTIQITANSFVQTPYLNPPEFYTKLGIDIPISADKMHAYMLGKNIYHYLTECDEDYLENRHDSKDLKFTHPIFQTEKGKQLEPLITLLVRENPDDRMSLEELRLKFAKFAENDRIIVVKRQNQLLLEEIEGLGLDVTRKAFINEKADLIFFGDNLKDLEALHDELQGVLTQKITSVKTQNLTLLKEIEGLILDATMNEFIKEKTDLILNSTSLRYLETLNNELQDILTQKITLIRTQNLTLLNEIGRLSPDATMKEFIKEKTDLLVNSTNLKDLETLSNELQDILITLVKTKNRTLLHEIQSNGVRRNDIAMQEFIEQKRDLITQSNHLNDLEDLNKELQRILIKDIKLLKTQIPILLNEIQKHGFGERDVKMEEFIKQKSSDLITHRNNLKYLDEMHEELNEILYQQQVPDEIKSIIQKFRNDADASFFTIGMRTKANKIEQAICSISIEERYKAMESTSKVGLEVHLAIASPRLFSFAQPVKITEDQIDETTAAKSYVHFKSQPAVIKVKDHIAAKGKPTI